MDKEFKKINERFLYNPKYHKDIKKCKDNALILADDIYISTDTNFVNNNLNTFVVGCAGSGKTRHCILPNILQANCSFIIYDCKGEILYRCKDFLISNGYKIKYINLVDFNKSMNYNPFFYIKDDKDIYALVDCIIDNSKGLKETNEVFRVSEKVLLSTFIFYIYKKFPKEKINFRRLIDLINSCDLLDENPFENLDMIFYELIDENISLKEEEGFKNICSNKIIKNVLESIIKRLSIFDKEELNSLDDLELEKIGFEKTAFFIIKSVCNSTYNSISSIIISQIMDILIKNGQNNGSKFSIHTRFLLDDFNCLGKIPNIENNLHQMNKYNISMNIFVESLVQVKDLYKNIWEKFLDNFDISIFLYSNIKDDIDYFCKFLTPNKIIEHRNITKCRNSKIDKIYNEVVGDLFITKLEDKKFLNFTIKKSLKANISNLNRVDIEDCLRRLDMNFCFVFIKDFEPILVEKYKVEKHPNFSKIKLNI